MSLPTSGSALVTPGRGERVVIGIGELAVTTAPDVEIVTHALGSCVAVCLWDPVTHVAGMLHFLLPESKLNAERAARQPGRARKRATDGIAGVWEVASALLRPAPKVPLNVEIGPARSFAWAEFSLGDFKAIKNAFGVTVNDVILTATSGGLRRWLHDREVETDGMTLTSLRGQR